MRAERERLEEDKRLLALLSEDTDECALLETALGRVGEVADGDMLL